MASASGTNALGAIISPWITPDDARDVSKTVGGELTLVKEYDQGNNPTDPWKVDTDGDGITDANAHKYILKGSDGLLDTDNDGLSNYAEYLLSEIFKLDNFDPRNAYSVSEFDIDYFYRVGEMYAGEIFTDHDWMEDTWENEQGLSYASPYVWDARSDNDEDGWSAFAENRYSQFVSAMVAKNTSHMLNGSEVRDMPVPAVKLTVRYNGTKSLKPETSGTSGTNTLATLYVSAWNDLAKDDPSAKWVITPGETVTRTAFIGLWRDATVGGTLTPGNINPNSVGIEFMAYNSNDTYVWRLYSEDLTSSAVTSGTYGEYLATVEAYRLYGTGYYDYETLSAKYGRVELIGSGNDWVTTDRVSVTSDATTEEGYICWGGERVGTINLVTGAYSLELGKLQHNLFESTNDMSNVVAVDNSIVRLVYSATIPTLQEKKTTLSLGLPDSGDPGYLKEGKVRIAAFYDLNGDGVYTLGEPYGMVDGVDVGWFQAAAEIELTDTGRFGSRINVTTAEVDETGESFSNVTQKSSAKLLYNINETVATEGNSRVRVVRYGICINSGTTATWSNLTSPGAAYAYTLFDKMLDINKQTVITEEDLLGPNDYDLEWSTRGMADKFDGSNPPSAVAYLVVIGDGQAYFTVSDTTKRDALKNVIVRRFDPTWQKPVAKSPGQNANMGVMGASPEFKWSMTNDTYTAFRVQVSDTNAASKVVWDSGVRRAPVRDSNGDYSFTPDLYAGDMLTPGMSYRWKVAMYNTKFYTNNETKVVWSDSNAFIMNTQTNGNVYGSIDVCVKYFGPKLVLTNSVVRVEAFDTPDFTGRPVARTFLANPASAGATNTVHTANATLVGLPRGTYYVRGYVDNQTYKSGTKIYTNGTDRVIDAWEPWGYVANRNGSSPEIFRPMSITVGETTGKNELVDLYIEDIDRNGNSLPDAWEMVKNKGALDSTTSSIDTISSSGIMINNAITSNLLTNQVGTAYTAVASMLTSTLKSAGVAALVLGVTPAAGQSESAAISAAVSGVNTTASADIGIENISVTNGVVVITASASNGKQTTTDATGNGFQKLYAATSTPSVISVTATIYYSYDLVTWQSSSQTVTVNVDSDGSTSLVGGNDISIDPAIVTGKDKCFFYITIE